jgi:hypothetical protein
MVLLCFDALMMGSFSAFLINFSTGLRIRRRISRLQTKLIVDISAAHPVMGQKGSIPCMRQYSVIRKDTKVAIVAKPAKTTGMIT